MKSIAIALAALMGGTAGVGCSGDENPGPLSNVDALIILQRAKRNETGDVFEYTSYLPGARLVKLSPPSADGTLTPICCDQGGPDFRNIDISSYDISFDAKQIVFSGKLAEMGHYGLFLLNLETNAIDELPTDPGRDYISPIFVPGDFIFFMTNAVVEVGGFQHEDEYERRTTTQVGRIKTDGSMHELGPRHLSHRVYPSLTSDGRVIMTQWNHLGGDNAAELMYMDPDMMNLREAFGREGTGAANSTIKPIEISPGRFVAIATARDRTVQAGSLIDIRLGTVVEKDGVVSAYERQAEARATYQRLSPDVPVTNNPSADTVGRFYDAYPLNAKDKPDLLVSWANGPVESQILEAANLSANFGIYLYDSERQTRLPILDDPMMWDIFPRPLRTRTAPPFIGSAIDPSLGLAAEIGSLNVYDSTMKDFAPGSIYGVRIVEGYSSEEGFGETFGVTMFEGQSVMGIAPVLADGSWRARVPGNVPLHLQAIDKFGMNLMSEPVWFSARVGEARMCGGCHEDRTKAVVVDPGQIAAFSRPPVNARADKARSDRNSDIFTRDELAGVPWDRAIQPVFNAKCVSCHGQDNTAGIAPYTITDPVTGESITLAFNLCGRDVVAGKCDGSIPNANIGGQDLGNELTYSYLSVMGLDREAVATGGLVMGGNYRTYANPENSRDSFMIRLLNPVQQWPTQNPNIRAFTTAPHMQGKGVDLTPDEFNALVTSIDLGGQYYSRENNPSLEQDDN
ncbi:MAG: hypothetical protein KF773_19725 [Deltaproteobacteria bacterium]|nr:hypothetical protein [Deltaproteobacteria bacterium]